VPSAGQASEAAPLLAAGVMLIAGPELASASGVLIPDVALTDQGPVQTETFSGVGSEYEFTFTVPAGSTNWLDMAFGGLSSEQFQVHGLALPCCYDEINYYSGDSSVSFGYGPGNWAIYVTYLGVPDPMGSFQLTDLSLDLPIPLAATPLPSTWTLMLIGLIGLGFAAYWRRKPEANFAAA